MSTEPLDLKTAAAPICHKGDQILTGFEHAWREPRKPDGDNDPYEETYRSCAYCGSMHPQDLFTALQDGAKVEGSDWKYGWPHKFYVRGVKNPRAGMPYTNYTTTSRDMAGQPGWEAFQDGFHERTGFPIMRWRKVDSISPAPAELPAKWYSIHFGDVPAETRQALMDAFNAASRNVKFAQDENGVKYSGTPSGG